MRLSRFVNTLPVHCLLADSWSTVAACLARPLVEAAARGPQYLQPGHTGSLAWVQHMGTAPDTSTLTRASIAAIWDETPTVKGLRLQVVSEQYHNHR
jgi:hypothetical protein